MQVLLSKQCLSLTGILERGTGYFLQARRTKSGDVRFYSQRSKYSVPPDGHWRFIVLCAELAQNRLYITDIRVSREEIKKALYEAFGSVAVHLLRKELYSAADILSIRSNGIRQQSSFVHFPKLHSGKKKGSAL